MGGLLAERRAVDSGEAAVTVVLRKPAPLDAPLQVRAGNLYDGATLIAETAVGELVRAAPPVVAFAQAEAATSSYQSNEMFAGCFVCGSGRSDGLRIEPGAVRDGVVAAPWTPDGTVPVDSALLWAAMDCPGGWSLPEMFDRPALLGSMTATVHALPEVGERCVVVGVNHGDQGRKSFASTAVYGSGDRLLGRAEQIWIRLDRPA